ncbi:zincin [Cylindrobasidium torrendii FP15055 ss-10]|uniref:Zincin n=1 Tax=Cylindrobasidium torrendii FP15055 ss-10 TaxID=1314674 RepID=A0A0D7AUA0_9AGAR|nr:zincin [Cylindrobasidium torrendii FP15055 ss-10]
MFNAAALFALVSASVALATQSVSISTSAPASVTDVTDFEVTTTITNTGDEALTLLKDPRTVLSSWATDAFTVAKEDGTAADFNGVAVRYISAEAAKLKKTTNDESLTTTLAPGESVDVVHELGNFYRFDNAGEGSFTVTPLSTLEVLAEDGSLSAIEAEVTGATVDIAGTLASAKGLRPTSVGGTAARVSRDASHLTKRATYSSCSSTRQSQNNAAITAASTLAKNSLTHLNANKSGSTLQTTWYGTFSSSHWTGTVKAFTGLQTEPASWLYDCTCTDSGTYAYVYPASYGEVYLCGYYWNAPATGSGSRADTIIHEGTHFPQILGTDDHTYGESSCKALAKSNPNNAYDNAEYVVFVVNNRH